MHDQFILMAKNHISVKISCNRKKTERTRTNRRGTAVNSEREREKNVAFRMQVNYLLPMRLFKCVTCEMFVLRLQFPQLRDFRLFGSGVCAPVCVCVNYGSDLNISSQRCLFATAATA